MPSFIDLSGAKFGRLSVVGLFEKTRSGARWRCRCDCGGEIVAYGSNLKNNTRSCGCIRREVTGAKNLAHGHARIGMRPPEYILWNNMKKRCLNPRDPKYPYYGGRGITVCARWSGSFEDFLADVGRRPTPSLSLDRIDNNGNYEPGNVRWATRHQQRVNQRPRRPKHATSSTEGT